MSIKKPKNRRQRDREEVKVLKKEQEWKKRMSKMSEKYKKQEKITDQIIEIAVANNLSIAELEYTMEQVRLKVHRQAVKN